MQALLLLSRFLSSAATACAVSYCLAATAVAVPLPPDGTVQLTGTSLAEQPELAGTVIADLVSPWREDAIGGTGTLQSLVVREASGTLDFYYRLTNDPTSAGDGLLFLTNFGFDPLTFDVDFRTDSVGTIAPSHADSSTSIRAVGFAFFERVVPAGEESVFMFIRTNTRTFALDPEGSEVALQDFDALALCGYRAWRLPQCLNPRAYGWLSWERYSS
jgi:hypothetical protein